MCGRDVVTADDKSNAEDTSTHFTPTISPIKLVLKGLPTASSTKQIATFLQLEIRLIPSLGTSSTIYVLTFLGSRPFNFRKPVVLCSVQFMSCPLLLTALKYQLYFVV